MLHHSTTPPCPACSHSRDAHAAGRREMLAEILAFLAAEKSRRLANAPAYEMRVRSELERTASEVGGVGELLAARFGADIGGDTSAPASEPTDIHREAERDRRAGWQDAYEAGWERAQ